MLKVTVYPAVGVPTPYSAPKYSWRTKGQDIVWTDHNTMHFTTDDNKRVSVRGGTIIVEEE